MAEIAADNKAPAGSGGDVLLEVKGPGDQLQKNQKRWMRYFDKLSIPYRVVNVMWDQGPEETRDAGQAPP